MMKMKNSKHNIELILRGNIYKAILSLAIPVMINSMMQTMYNLTDTYWLGKIGTNELAAINLITPLQNIIINFGLGITVAGSVLIAQYIGGGAIKEAKDMANQIFSCAMIFGVCCATICFAATPQIVAWMGADGETFRHSVIYMRIVIWDMPFLFMVNIFSAINQAQGDTVRPMLLNLGGILINMILDPLLMLGLSLGTAGAALATLFAKIIPAVAAFVILSKPDKDICLDRSRMRVKKETLKTILRIGLPTALGGSAFQFGFLLMSRNVFAYGTQAMAAYGIGNKVNGMITLPANGIGSAVSTIVGQNMGADQPERAKKAYKVSMLLCITFLFSGGMVLSRDFASTAMVSIFSKDPEVIAMAADFLSVMAFWCFTNGVYNCSTGLFNGTGHTEITMAMEATRLWVFRFFTLWFCETVLDMGVRSVWYSVVVSNGVGAMILFVIYCTGIWKKPRIKVNKN